MATPRSKLYNHVLDGAALEATEFPPRTWLVENVLPHASIGMVYARDGVGKTWVSMALALAVAKGEQWIKQGMRAEKPRHVLYVDGEMKAEDLRERLVQLNGAGLPSNLKVLSLAGGTVDLDLKTPADWESIVQLIQDYYEQGVEIELVILDNWASLVFEKDENDNAEVKKIFKWPIQLRQAGVSTLWVHHAGASGSQRGATARRGPLDYVLVLERPEDHPPSGTARFVLDFDKTRRKPSGWQPFDVELTETREGRLIWEWKSDLTSYAAKLLTLMENGEDGQIFTENKLRILSKLNGTRTSAGMKELAEGGYVRRAVVKGATAKSWRLA